ncbi:MAG: hypothetical protein ACXVJ7_15825 [Acidimicrobiia bacterium]
MSPSDDPTGDMAFLSSDDADRLLSGISPLETSDARGVERLLAALRSPMSSDEAHEQTAVASFAAASAAAPTRLDDARSQRMNTRRVPLKLAVAAAAVVLLGGTAAAAATGSLPDSAQRAVSHALAHVSVDVPEPGGDSGHAAEGHDASPVGPDATGPAAHGLCTAWAARNRTDADRGHSGDSTAFSNLRKAAHDQGLLVKEFCAEQLDGGRGSGADSDHGAPTDPGASGDHGHPAVTPGPTGRDPGASGDHPGQHGSDGDHGPVVETPNPGGNGTGSDPSHGESSAGVAQVPAASGTGDGHANGNAAGSRP